MGVFGAGIGSSLGGTLGTEADSALGKRIGGKKGGKLAGRILGGTLGAIGKIGGTMAGATLVPFKHGGKVPGPKGKPVPILAHAGEYILPLNSKPSKAQKAIVAKNKKNNK